jgi:hypothetical protein
MTLVHPVIITPRLLPGVEISDAHRKCWVSIAIMRNRRGEALRTGDGRMRFRVWIDTPEWTHTDTNLSSGCHARDDLKTLREGLVSCLAFLCASAEDYRAQFDKYRAKNRDKPLHPKRVREWAYLMDDEISTAKIEIEENPNCIR